MRAALLIAIVLCGCSAIVDDSTQQCKLDSDCSALGLAGSTCRDSVCTSPLGAVPTGGCTTHSECTTKAGGVPSICRSADGKCATLFTAECPNVLPEGAETRDDMFLVGFMGIVDGEGASYGQAQLAGESRALSELQDTQGRLPGATVSDPPRNLAVLVCNHTQADGTPAAKHLIDDLKVPAILGASFSGVTIKAFSQAATSGTLMFSPAATSPALTQIDRGTDLFFRTVPSDVVQTGALKLLVPLVTDVLRKRGVLAAGQAPVIIRPYKKDAAGDGLLNGTLSEPNAVSGETYQYDASALEDPNTAAQVAAHIVAAAPHIILHLGTSEFVQFVMPLIERTWTAKDRPWYIVPEGDLEQLKDKSSEPWITSNNVAARLIGTTPGGRRSRDYNIFKTKFMSEPGNLAEFAYDAAYMLAYAIAASNKQHPTGVELAAGLRKTSCTTPGAPHIAGGTEAFTMGWNAAAAGCINYYGASGELDFDQFGDTETDISVGCLSKSTDHYEFTRVDTYYAIASKSLVVTNVGAAPLDLSNPGWCAPFKP